MLPIYPASIIRLWDEYTMLYEPITSVDLMERAAMACTGWITENIKADIPIAIVCGNGNNGGDAFVIARHLFHSNFKVSIYINDVAKRSTDNAINFERLLNQCYAEIIIIPADCTFHFPENTLIVDGIFGTGLTRKVDGFWENVIRAINKSECKVISIDLPSGLHSGPGKELPSVTDSIVKADITLTFQTPKLSMLISGWGQFCGLLEILNIGLHSNFIDSNPTNHFFITKADIQQRFIKREKFSHKGTYGHAFIIAGHNEKCGAAILSSKACIKSGAGRVSLHSGLDCISAVNTSVPEVMIERTIFEKLDLTNYSSIGIGPGIGTDIKKAQMLAYLMENAKCPLLLDADAISILAQSENTFKLPANTILTPHPKEFDRLVGLSSNAFDRLNKANDFAKEKNVILVLKGAYTAICSPDGNIYFNSTGNQGMATAGSGDVLTGMITAFLAQGHQPMDSAILGVYCHGKSGDFAANRKSMTGLLASDIIDNLDLVFSEFE